jgi:hypothetical protein
MCEKCPFSDTTNGMKQKKQKKVCARKNEEKIAKNG